MLKPYVRTISRRRTSSAHSLQHLRYGQVSDSITIVYPLSLTSYVDLVLCLRLPKHPQLY
jgi:hypothetical protein